MNNTTSHRVQRQIVNIFCDLWSVPAPRQRAAFCVLQHLSVAFINFQPCILCHIICATAVRSLWLSGCQKEGLVARWQDWGVKHRRLFFFFSFFFSFFPARCQLHRNLQRSGDFSGIQQLECERWRWFVIFSNHSRWWQSGGNCSVFTPPCTFNLTVWYYFEGKISKQAVFWIFLRLSTKPLNLRHTRHLYLPHKDKTCIIWLARLM